MKTFLRYLPVILLLFSAAVPGMSQVVADDEAARVLLQKINENRSRNNPDARPQYTIRLYDRMHIGFSHPEVVLDSRFIDKRFPFAKDYVTTSAANGAEYLPSLISEAVAVRQHSSNPLKDSEEIVANRVSGVNPDYNLLSQFTGSVYVRANFYSDFIDALGINFVSPLIDDGLQYYSYQIVDTVYTAGRPELLVRFAPRPLVSSPAFEGEMYIDLEDYALRSIHADMSNAVNVNHIRDFILDSSFKRLEGSGWFFDEDRLFADLSLSKNDSSKIVSFHVNRDITYGEPDFVSPLAQKSTDAPATVAPDAGHYDERYWNSVRPSPLSEVEAGIYPMVDKVQGTNLYKTLYHLIYTLANGYMDIGDVGFGPFYKWLSFNNTEGMRPQFGIRSSRDWSHEDRLSAYVAYGTKDKIIKAGTAWEHLFSTEPMRKFIIGAKYDRVQLGTPNDALYSGNFFYSLLGAGTSDRSSLITEYRASYEHEFSPSYTATAKIGMRRYFPSASVPLITPAGEPVKSVATNELHLISRISWSETASRGIYEKTYIRSDYPVFTIDLCGSVPGLRDFDYGYFRPEASMNWKLYTPPLGVSEIYVNAGTLVGQVPYTFLHIHEGNNTYLINKRAFSTMQYFEFASDSWATVFWNHSFGGFFLGKIPLIRKLGLREELTLRSTWGHLSDKNNGDIALLQTGTVQAPLLFPEGMRALGKTPFVEVGAGISNIFRVLRVDFFWRLTHRDENTKNFAVNIGAELKF